MFMLCKTVTVYLRVADPHLIFDRIYVITIRTHMRRLLTVDLALYLKQVLSLYPIPIIPNIISGGDIYRNSTSGSTIDPSKQWVVVINGFIIKVNNYPSPPLYTPYHEPIVGVIYNIFSQIILEIRLGLHRTSDALLYQPDIDHINHKNR